MFVMPPGANFAVGRAVREELPRSSPGAEREDASLGRRAARRVLPAARARDDDPAIAGRAERGIRNAGRRQAGRQDARVPAAGEPSPVTVARPLAVERHRAREPRDERAVRVRERDLHAAPGAVAGVEVAAGREPKTPALPCPSPPM